MISEPSSRKAYVSISGPPFVPLTLTGTMRRLTRGFPEPIAAHWPSTLSLPTLTVLLSTTVSAASLLTGWVLPSVILSP